MGINLSNFLTSKSQNRNLNQYQDLDHIDGLSISTVCANLYQTKRDDLVMFYFRQGANFASVYTRSKILSENIKWNLNQKVKKNSGLGRLMRDMFPDQTSSKYRFEELLQKPCEIECELNDEGFMNLKSLI